MRSLLLLFVFFSFNLSSVNASMYGLNSELERKVILKYDLENNSQQLDTYTIADIAHLVGIHPYALVSQLPFHRKAYCPYLETLVKDIHIDLVIALRTSTFGDMIKASCRAFRARPTEEHRKVLEGMALIYFAAYSAKFGLVHYYYPLDPIP